MFLFSNSHLTVSSTCSSLLFSPSILFHFSCHTFQLLYFFFEVLPETFNTFMQISEHFCEFYFENLSRRLVMSTSFSLLLVSYPVVLIVTYSSTSSFCQDFCVSSFVLDRSTLLPDLESNGFMKKASCGDQKLMTLCCLVPSSSLQWSPIVVGGL